MLTHSRTFATLASVALIAGLTITGCNKTSEGRAKARTVKASMAEFDPNADLDLDAWGGSERPDDYAVQMAFNATTEQMDACIAEFKTAKGIKTEKQLDGDFKAMVKLNPKKSTPLGVNAELPAKYASDAKLTQCMRDAVGAAPYPTYDGPPIVVEFTTQLDAGFAEYDDWDE
jgi:hypothetical protein